MDENLPFYYSHFPNSLKQLKLESSLAGPHLPGKSKPRTLSHAKLCNKALSNYKRLGSLNVQIGAPYSISKSVKRLKNLSHLNIKVSIDGLLKSSDTFFHLNSLKTLSLTIEGKSALDSSKDLQLFKECQLT